MTALLRAGASPLAINQYERNGLFALRPLFAGNGEAKQFSSSASAAAAAIDASALAPNTATSFTARYFKSHRMADVRLRLQVGAETDYTDLAASELAAAATSVPSDAGAAATAASSHDIPAHRLVLCAQSDFFRALLDPDVTDTPGGVRWAYADNIPAEASAAAPASAAGSGGGGGLDDEDDAGATARGPPVVVLSGVPSLASFDLLLKYLYTGSLVFLSDELSLAAATLELATRYLVEPLRMLLQRHLAARIVPANVDQLLRLAEHTHARFLRARCIYLALDQYAALVAARPSLAEADVQAAKPPHAFLIRMLESITAADMQAAAATGVAKANTRMLE